MGIAARLSFTSIDGKQCSRRISGSIFRIGRYSKNDLSFDNPYISRFHAEIISDDSSYLINDLGSTSGTFINDERVKSQVLKDGDRIRFGKGHGIEVVFHADDCESRPEDEVEELDSTLQPMRVIIPEDTRFIDTSKLPVSEKLRSGTVERLRALYEFTSELLTAHSSQELSTRLAAFLHKALNAERCAIMLWVRESDSFEAAACYPANQCITPSRSIINRVFDENVAVLSVDASNDSRFSAGDSVRLQSIHSVICAPIGSKTRLWGVCYVDNVTSERAFDEDELEFLTAVARQSGLALENLYLLEEQRRSLESFIRTLSASLDARDDSTAGHSARVGAYSAGIARIMGLNEAEARLIYYAGLLHDYGKIGIRDDVLLKPAELTPEEYETIKQHPLHTFKLLSKIRLPEDLASIPFVAAAHHERWDGSGYPHGLKGEEIPIGSRIVAVADAFDALTEQRVYHEPWEPERAIAELSKRAGTYFDPAVIEAFIVYFNQNISHNSERRARRRKVVEEPVNQVPTL